MLLKQSFHGREQFFWHRIVLADRGHVSKVTEADQPESSVLDRHEDLAVEARILDTDASFGLHENAQFGRQVFSKLYKPMLGTLVIEPRRILPVNGIVVTPEDFEVIDHRNLRHSRTADTRRLLHRIN